VTAALLNTGGASVQCRKVWLTPTTRVPCSKAAKMRNPLKLAGVRQTRQQISAASRPKFTMLWGHVEEVLLFNKFFFRLSIRALVVKIWPDKVVHWCRDGDFLRLVFSDLHSKFVQRPHHVTTWGNTRSRLTFTAIHKNCQGVTLNLLLKTVSIAEPLQNGSMRKIPNAVNSREKGKEARRMR